MKFAVVELIKFYAVFKFQHSSFCGFDSYHGSETWYGNFGMIVHIINKGQFISEWFGPVLQHPVGAICTVFCSRSVRERERERGSGGWYFRANFSYWLLSRICSNFFCSTWLHITQPALFSIIHRFRQIPGHTIYIVCKTLIKVADLQRYFGVLVSTTTFGMVLMLDGNSRTLKGN